MFNFARPAQADHIYCLPRHFHQKTVDGPQPGLLFLKAWLRDVMTLPINDITGGLPCKIRRAVFAEQAALAPSLACVSPDFPTILLKPMTRSATGAERVFLLAAGESFERAIYKPIALLEHPRPPDRRCGAKQFPQPALGPKRLPTRRLPPMMRLILRSQAG